MIALASLLLALAPFSSIDVEGDVHVLVEARGAEASATASSAGAAEGAAPADVKLEVKDRVLHIVAPASSKKDLTVRVVATSLTGVRAAGAARVDVTKLDGKSLDAVASEAAHLNLGGRCASARITGSGSARIDAEQLNVTDLRVVLERAARATVSPSGSLDVEQSGASVLTVTTKPRRLTKKTSGASRLKLP